MESEKDAAAMSRDGSMKPSSFGENKIWRERNMEQEFEKQFENPRRAFLGVEL